MKAAFEQLLDFGANFEQLLEFWSNFGATFWENWSNLWTALKLLTAIFCSKLSKVTCFAQMSKFVGGVFNPFHFYRAFSSKVWVRWEIESANFDFKLDTKMSSNFPHFLSSPTVTSQLHSLTRWLTDSLTTCCCEKHFNMQQKIHLSSTSNRMKKSIKSVE